MGILICGLNGTGKSTLGAALALALGWRFIDNEDLFFPKDNPSYLFASPRSREEAIALLEEQIRENDRFVFAAVRGDYGPLLASSLSRVIVLEVPPEVRKKRVRERSYRRFGDRIMPGGDLFERESAWFHLTDSRSESYVWQWLQTVDCPVIRLDGTRGVEENIRILLPQLRGSDPGI